MAVALAVAGTARVEAVNGLTPGTQAVPRVRTTDPGIDALMKEASRRSATFRRIVDTIEASDGIVYVEPGTCGMFDGACLATVTTAGPNRILQVRVDPGKVDWDLMGSIGHELWHATEVLGNSSVTNTVAMQFFYAREGRRIRQGFETDAAVRAGNAVRREVRRALRAANDQ
jgi:hypothetical protein